MITSREEVENIGLRERESEPSTKERGRLGICSCNLVRERAKNNELFWVQTTYKALKRNYQNAH